MIRYTPSLRKVRIHLEERDGRLRKAARVLFTGTDASIYLVPYARGTTFEYGRSSIAPDEVTHTFKTSGQANASENPKVSIHETGEVHIYAKDAPKVGPLRIPPIPDLRGEHIATVQWDAIALVPEMQKRTKMTSSEEDWAFGVPEGSRAGALLLYANGDQPAFTGSPIQAVFQIEREGKRPVYFGLMVIERAFVEGTPTQQGGVTVLAGFDPRKRPAESLDFLFLRGS